MTLTGTSSVFQYAIIVSPLPILFLEFGVGCILTLLHSEWSKLQTILAFLSAIGLTSISPANSV